MINNNFKNIIYIYVSQFLRLLTGFGVLYILTKNLDLENFGKFNVFKSFISILGVFLSLGFESVIVRYLPEFQKNSNFNHSYFLMTKILKFRFMSILFASMILFFNKSSIESYFNLNSTEILLIPFVLLLTKINSILGTSFLTSILKVYKEKKVQILYDIFKLVGFYFIAQLNSVIYLVSFWMVLELLSLSCFTLIFLNYFKKFKKSISSKISDETIKRIFSFAKFQTIASGLFILVDLSTDNIMIAYFLTNKDVAIYSFGLGLLAYLSNLNPSFLLKNYLTSYLTKSYNGVINKSFINKINFLFRFTILTMIPIYCVLALNIKHIITLVFDEKYLPAVNLILVGLIFQLFKELTSTFSPLINLFEKNKLFLIAGIFSIFNFLTNIFLIPKLGIIGALLGTGTTWALVFIFYVSNFFKTFNTPDFFPIKLLVSSILISLVFYCVISQVLITIPKTYFSLFLNLTWQFILLVFVFNLFNIFRFSDIKILIKMIKSA